MKNLFNVLLISTLAIGSFVTALGDQQAPLPAELNPAQPVMPVMAGIVDPECRDGSCHRGRPNCDHACKAGEDECNKKCGYTDDCTDKCKASKLECKKKCLPYSILGSGTSTSTCDDVCNTVRTNCLSQYHSETPAGSCLPCVCNADGTLTSVAQPPALQCTSTAGLNCFQPCKRWCDACNADFASCKSLCTSAVEECEEACDKCDKKCDDACDDSKYTCKKACECGEKRCNDKLEEFDTNSE